MTPMHGRLHISAFPLNGPMQHGGVKRSRQLHSFVNLPETNHIVTPSSYREILSHTLRYPWSAFVALAHAIALFGTVLSMKGVAAAVVYGAWLHKILSELKPEEVHIELAPNSSLLLGKLLVSFRKKIHVYPHNIEFMVPNQNQSYFFSPETAQKAEMDLYRQALSVTTISHFDAAVLRCFGIRNVQTLQFLPVEEDLIFFREIKEKRKNSEKHGILILGSVVNPPTRAGVLRLLDLIQLEKQGRNYILAGYGTEGLNALAPSNVDVRGALSEGELQDILVRCEALLLYQTQTSGMVTRLIEASIADIPVYVMGNYLQCLELRHSGVFEIDEIGQIPLNSDDCNLDQLVVV